MKKNIQDHNHIIGKKIKDDFENILDDKDNSIKDDGNNKCKCKK